MLTRRSMGHYVDQLVGLSMDLRLLCFFLFRQCLMPGKFFRALEMAMRLKYNKAQGHNNLKIVVLGTLGVQLPSIYNV